jgi:hypothetical protein
LLYKYIQPLSGRQGRAWIPAGKTATRTLRGEDYLKNWALPNMFFHITTAYAILRHNGVAVGKTEFLMGSGA